MYYRSLLNGGRETLCAYGKSRFVFEEALCRLDRLYSCMYVERAMDQWLNIRVEYLGGVVMFAVTCIGIFQKLRSPDGRMPGETLALISLSLTMCVDLFWSLPLIVKVSAWTEASMNSVQRITHYVEQIDREELLSCADAGEMDDDAGAVDHVDIITDGGPILGGNSGALVPPASSSMLVFEHVCMRYRAGLPYVLRDVSFRIGAREKVGIVGRTGSGKSTLLLTFMRLVEISEGCMYVVGRRATDYSLPALRRQFALIPQDPVLFEGTVRSNLDPFGKCSEAELCRVLALIGLTDAAAASATVTEEVGEREAEAEEEEPERVTPDTVVSEGGKNFSVGQRQLLCMGRALLKKGNQFVLMDEATANVDPVLDERIQRVVHTCFAPYVVVTIAHRLHTVASYDRIIVLHRGRVVEQGAPAALIEQPSSQLRQMVVRSATGPSTPPGQRDALVAEAVRMFTQRCRAVEQKNK